MATKIKSSNITDDAISEEHLDVTAITGNAEIAASAAADDVLLIYDTSSGTINVLLPQNPTIGKVWNFKKLSINNIFRITCRFGELIDGLTTWDITGFNNTYSIQYDGTNYNII